MNSSGDPSGSLEILARMKVRVAMNSFERHYVVNRDHYT